MDLFLDSSKYVRDQHILRSLKRGYADCLEERMENSRPRRRIITHNWQIIDNLFANFQKKCLFNNLNIFKCLFRLWAARRLRRLDFVYAGRCGETGGELCGRAVCAGCGAPAGPVRQSAVSSLHMCRYCRWAVTCYWLSVAHCSLFVKEQ